MIATIAELQSIVVQGNGEPLLLFDNIWVRKSVAEKLQRIKQKAPIQLREGYRSPKRQEEYFEAVLRQKNYTLEKAHQFVAYPEVAGHPTGGAVDLTLSGIDMGCEIADLSKPLLMPTHSPWVTEEQRKSRLYLHDLMLEEGFAPFYGEWWHFSYGDREWAWFYKQRAALYSVAALSERRFNPAASPF